MTYINSSGYYVLYGSTLDMVRQNKPLKIGTATYKNSSGYGSRSKRLSYLREKNGNYIRLYDSRRLHSWMNEKTVMETFPEFFI